MDAVSFGLGMVTGMAAAVIVQIYLAFVPLLAKKLFPIDPPKP